LRWLAADKRSGTAVLLSEEPLEEFVGGEGDDCSLRCIERLERQYLLWGSVSSSESDGWSKLAEGRLAPFRVPGSYSSGHVVLKVREYLGVDEYGNAAVVEELFEGLTQKGGEIA
jgi:CRISPR-associated protein (TIGR03984 family)